MEEPQLFVVSGDVAVVVVAAGLVEERMVCLGQQHSGNKAVVIVAVVKDSTIKGWDDSSTQDCTCC